jgi:hypothetical protein
MNKSTINFKEIINGKTKYVLPENSKYLTLHFEDMRLKGFTVEYESKKRKIDMEVTI